MVAFTVQLNLQKGPVPEERSWSMIYQWSDEIGRKEAHARAAARMGHELYEHRHAAIEDTRSHMLDRNSFEV